MLSPPPFRASDYENDHYPHLLLACTGSVATIKLPNILHALSFHNLAIRIILSRSATNFLQGQSAEQPLLSTLLEIHNVEAIYTDEDEWVKPWVRGDAILHIELRRWADMMAIVPLSADALAKMVNGISDNLVLSVARAWDTTGFIDMPRRGLVGDQSATDLVGAHQRSYRTEVGKKVLLVAPAMNTAMWEHPVTSKQLIVLEREWGVDVGGWVHILRPVEKELACGDTGAGAMRDWKEIVLAITTRLRVDSSVN